ncbi:gp23 [Listeria phage P40]|nr:gp23 [Listeria phage P40]ACI00383.1 gp23 [Listeria phage P40]
MINFIMSNIPVMANPISDKEDVETIVLGFTVIIIGMFLLSLKRDRK